METEMTTYSESIGVRHISNSARIWYIVGGIAFLIMALFAFTIPVAATFAANLWLGALLIVAGIVETIGAFRRHDGWGAAGEALFGIVTAIAGIVAVVFPLIGVFAFTMAVITFFLFSGAVRLIQAFRRRSGRLWYLRLISGLVSIGLGLFLLFLLPNAALITLGILLAVDFTVFAISLILIGVYGERPVIEGEGVPAL
jgi:uncharacterized membrane protein HdeD (DUF308 family)